MRKNFTVCPLLTMLLAAPFLWACSDDEETTPVVDPIVVEAEYTDITDWFSSTLPSTLSATEYKATESKDGLSTSFYEVQFGDLEAHLDVSTLSDNSENWLYEVTPTADSTQVTFFKEALNAYLDNSAYEYWNTLYTTSESTSSQSLTQEELMTKLESADFTQENFRTGFRTENETAEISIKNGEAKLQVRPFVFGDNWKYYTQHLLAQDYDSLYQDLYFSIKSSGFIPPFYQLMIFNGKDDNGTSFNLTLQALPGEPVSLVEGAYLLDDDEVQSYWTTLLEASDAEEKMGTFEQTFVFASNNNLLATLNTLDETVEWAKNNDIADVGYVMPIFRISDTLVVIPQVSTSAGLVVTMSELAAEETTEVKARKLKAIVNHN